MTNDPQREPATSDIPHVDGPEDPTPADVPRGEAEVPHTDDQLVERRIE